MVYLRRTARSVDQPRSLTLSTLYLYLWTRSADVRVSGGSRARSSTLLHEICLSLRDSVRIRSAMCVRARLPVSSCCGCSCPGVSGCMSSLCVRVCVSVGVCVGGKLCVYVCVRHSTDWTLDAAASIRRLGDFRPRIARVAAAGERGTREGR